jgi:hypothetical protein
MPKFNLDIFVDVIVTVAGTITIEAETPEDAAKQYAEFVNSERNADLKSVADFAAKHTLSAEEMPEDGDTVVKQFVHPSRADGTPCEANQFVWLDEPQPA